MTVQDLRSTQARDAGQAERAKLRRELSRLDTIFFLISAMVVVDTIGAIAVGGGQAFTWLVVLFVFFFIPSALASAELGAAIPDEGGAYVWVRMAFGRFAGALTSLLYWAGTPMWLGGSVAVVAMSVYGRFFGELSQPALYLFGAGFIGLATLGAVVPLRYGKWLPTSGAIGQIGLLAFFTVSVALYGARHGAHGIAVGDLTPTSATFIAVVPVLLYSFVGVELPSTAGEEMRNPRRDIPVAIARAGIGQALMYGIPILAVLVVLPAEQVTSLGGLIDAMKTVFTVYGGSVAADGTGRWPCPGPVSCSAGPAPWSSSGSCWPAARPGSWGRDGPRRRPAWTAPGRGPWAGSRPAPVCRWSWGWCRGRCRWPRWWPACGSPGATARSTSRPP